MTKPMQEMDILDFMGEPNVPTIEESKPLTKRERLFVAAFDGDIAQTMRLAGYVGHDSTLEQKGKELLKQPNIQYAIRKRAEIEERTNQLILTREERLVLLSAIARNADPHAIEEKDSYGNIKDPENIPMAQRLKAIELLGKAQGDFSETLNINHNVTISDLILRSFQDDTPIEVIEAEYKKMKESEKLPPPSDVEDLV